MDMELCPKYDRCSAPICPLDPHWRESTYLEGERVCLYLRELAKGGDLGCRGSLPRGMALIVGRAYQQIVHTGVIGALCGHGALRRALRYAANHGSKLSGPVPSYRRRRSLSTEAAE